VGRHIAELMLATASVQRSTSERLGYGQAELMDWQAGKVM
jgi:altronate dehydratase